MTLAGFAAMAATAEAENTFQVWVTTVDETIVCETNVEPVTVTGIVPLTTTGSEKVRVMVVLAPVIVHVMGLSGMTWPRPSFRRLTRCTFPPGYATLLLLSRAREF